MDSEGVAKAAEEEEPEPDNEETLLMKQMMGFSKFDTTKARVHNIVRKKSI